MNIRHLVILMLLLAAVACREKGAVPVLPYSQMREGDLAFRCGRGIISRSVIAIDSEGIYSHIGILTNTDGKWNVIHAVPGEKDNKDDFERVKEESVESFFAPERACRGCLIHSGMVDSIKLKAICRDAIQFARDSVRFDNAFDLQDSTEVYCTELVWRIFRRQGIDLSEGRRKYVNIMKIKADCLLPEHLLNYSQNITYYSF